MKREPEKAGSAYSLEFSNCARTAMTIMFLVDVLQVVWMADGDEGLEVVAKGILSLAQGLRIAQVDF